MPLWVGELFGDSAIVITTLCAIVLNLVLPKLPEDNVALQAAEEASEALEEAEPVIYDALAKGQDPDAASFEEANDREESN